MCTSDHEDNSLVRDVKQSFVFKMRMTGMLIVTSLALYITLSRQIDKYVYVVVVSLFPNTIMV